MTTEQFKQWAKERNVQLIDSFDGLKPGDIVTHTNDYGVKFHNRTVIGIAKDETSWGARIYLDDDSWWHPIKVQNIKLQK